MSSWGRWIRSLFPSEPPFRIRPTRLGIAFLAICLFAAGAATNTGNNGLFIISALLLGGLAVSGFVSRRNLWCLTARLAAPEDVFAARPTPFRVGLEVSRGKRASRAILLEDEVATTRQAIFVGAVSPESGVSIELSRSYPRRGRHPGPAVLVSSRFPFGFFEKARRLGGIEEIVVFPEVVRLSEELVRAAGGGQGEEPSRRRGRSPEIDSLRRFHWGDDPRDIHWKQSARQRRLIVKQRLAEGSGWTTIVLDAGRAASESERERAISTAASLAVALLERGRRVALRTRGLDLPPAGGRTQRARILRSLALLEAEERLSPLRLERPLPGEIQVDVWEVA